VCGLKFGAGEFGFAAFEALDAVEKEDSGEVGFSGSVVAGELSEFALGGSDGDIHATLGVFGWSFRLGHGGKLFPNLETAKEKVSKNGK
jgi:hypothetical protein